MGEATKWSDLEYVCMCVYCVCVWVCECVCVSVCVCGWVCVDTGALTKEANLLFTI